MDFNSKKIIRTRNKKLKIIIFKFKGKMTCNNLII